MLLHLLSFGLILLLMMDQDLDRNPISQMPFSNASSCFPLILAIICSNCSILSLIILSNYDAILVLYQYNIAVLGYNNGIDRKDYFCCVYEQIRTNIVRR